VTSGTGGKERRSLNSLWKAKKKEGEEDKEEKISTKEDELWPLGIHFSLCLLQKKKETKKGKCRDKKIQERKERRDFRGA